MQSSVIPALQSACKLEQLSYNRKENFTGVISLGVRRSIWLVCERSSRAGLQGLVKQL